MKIIETLDGDLININNFQSIIYQERERDYAEPHHVQIRANGDVWDFDFATQKDAEEFILRLKDFVTGLVFKINKNFRIS